MPMRLCKWSCACLVFLTTGFYAAGWSDNLSGQVNQNVTNMPVQETSPSNPGSLTQSLTLTPGAGQFSKDRLGFARQVVITLYNPNPYAMRFDTTQRLGKDYSWVVPANSQRTVSFRYWNPFSDEVKFLSYQDPGSLIISQGRVSQPATEAAIGPPSPMGSVEQSAESQTTVSPSEPSTMQQQATEEQTTQSQSAVRGYW